MKISWADKEKHHSSLLSELDGEWIASRSDHLTPWDICHSVGLRAGLDAVAKMVIPTAVRDTHTVMRSIGIRLSELPRLVTGRSYPVNYVVNKIYSMLVVFGI
jgi:hypothetical protein